MRPPPGSPGPLPLHPSPHRTGSPLRGTGAILADSNGDPDGGGLSLALWLPLSLWLPLALALGPSLAAPAVRCGAWQAAGQCQGASARRGQSRSKRPPTPPPPAPCSLQRVPPGRRRCGSRAASNAAGSRLRGRRSPFVGPPHARMASATRPHHAILLRVDAHSPRPPPPDPLSPHGLHRSAPTGRGHTLARSRGGAWAARGAGAVRCMAQTTASPK